MNTQLKALAQHLDLDYFTYNNENGESVCYLGMTQDDFDEIENDLLDKLETRDEVNDAINEILDGLTLLEDELIVSSYDDNVIEYEGAEYLVVDDSEADRLWEESLDNYLQECIYPELEGSLAQYFDEDKWKNDARYDGRGHSLSSYDGEENEETVEDETYYIFRTN